MTETPATPLQVGDRSGEPGPDTPMPRGPSTARTVVTRRVRFDEGLDELSEHWAPAWSRDLAAVGAMARAMR